MKLKAILGKNVKYYRFKERLTQEQLAEKLDLSPNYIGRLERGLHNPSLDTIEDIARGLNIEPYELFINRANLNKIPNRLYKNKTDNTNN